MNLQAELKSFHEFASAKAASGQVESLQELVDLWYIEHPPLGELQESLASLQRGLADAEAGRVHPADEVIRELRDEIDERS